MENLQYDVFPTPVDICYAVMQEVKSIEPCFIPKIILDAGAGEDGRWGVSAKKIYKTSILHGIEIRDVNKPEEYDLWITGDYLTWGKVEEGGLYDMVVMNPPFKQIITGKQRTTKAELFIRKALEDVRAGGLVVALVRQAFIGTLSRIPLFTEYPLYYEFVLAPRPIFVGTRSDSKTEYVAAIWKKGYVGDWNGRIVRWR